MSARALIAFLVAGLLLSVAAPAFGVQYYGSKSHPIKAEAGSDAGNAWFYGNTRVHRGTHLRNGYGYRDSAPGGNAAYVETHWYYWRPTSTNPNGAWDESGSKDQSTRYRGFSWRYETDYELLRFDADRGRIKTEVCEDQNNQPDDCSPDVIKTHSY